MTLSTQCQTCSFKFAVSLCVVIILYFTLHIHSFDIFRTISEMLLYSRMNCNINAHVMLRLSQRFGSSMVAQPIGNGLMFHASDSVNVAETKGGRTLAVVTGWMGSKTSQLKPYIKYYNDQGIDAVSLSVGPAHILFPNKAQEQMKQVMDEVLKKSPSKVIVHQFSMGGYLYSQLLRVMTKNQPDYKEFGDKISAQIFDSPPDVQGIAYGISRGVKPEFIQDVVKSSLDLVLKLLENGIGKEHRAASKQMHENYITAPSLWFYSHADVIAPAKDCEVVIQRWRDNNIVVEACVFENTKHIQHGRAEPERYFSTLDSFLKDKCEVLKK